MPDWLQIHAETSQAEELSELLSELGAVAVTFGDAQDQPVLEPAPGETPLWELVTVTGLWPGETQAEPLAEVLNKHPLVHRGSLKIESLEDRAWEREWLKDYQPIPCGENLWVSPHGDWPQIPADATVVRLDPGLAFGTGTHPTTWLCLKWLDGADLKGKHVIDYGCGSGILAVAAALLGAESVIASDIDPQALQATQDNAAANDVADKIKILPVDECLERKADIVLANILAGTLIDLAQPISQMARQDSELVLSGILAEQAQDVQAAYADQFLLTQENSEAWVRLDGRRFA